MKYGRFNAEFLPSEIAFATVMCARKLHRIEPGWNKLAFEHILEKAGRQAVDLFYERLLKCQKLFRDMAKSDSESPLHADDVETASPVIPDQKTKTVSILSEKEPEVVNFSEDYKKDDRKIV